MKKPVHLATLLLVMAGVILFQACKKDEKDTPKTKTELITTGTWKMTANTINPAIDIDFDGDTETNLFDFLEGCFKDDFTTFKTNGTAEGNEGASKCDSADPQTYSLTWSFASNETKLNIDGDEYNLVELTGTKLKISYSLVDNGVTYTQEITFAHCRSMHPLPKELGDIVKHFEHLWWDPNAPLPRE
jgi:hypothetical protein